MHSDKNALFDIELKVKVTEKIKSQWPGRNNMSPKDNAPGLSTKKLRMYSPS